MPLAPDAEGGRGAPNRLARTAFMTIHFTLASVPELAGLAPYDRRLAYEACRRKTYRRWQVWAAALAGLLIGSLAGWYALRFVLNLDADINPLFKYFLGGLPWGVLAYGGWEYAKGVAVLSLIGPHIREYLALKKKAESTHKVEIDYLREPFEDPGVAEGE